MASIGYGERTWYDPGDHTRLHADLADPARFEGALQAVNRRPNMQRSVLGCAECQQLLSPQNPDTPARPVFGRRVRLIIPLQQLADALGVPADHQALYLTGEPGETMVVVVQCPAEEEDTCPLEATATTVVG